MTEPRRLHLTGTVLALVLLAGCTSGPATTGVPSATTSSATPSPSATPAAVTPTPSPSRTWNPTQATAIKVVEDYLAARDVLFANPSRFTKAQARSALQPYAANDMLDGYLELFAKLKAAGEHYEGPAHLAWTAVSGVFGSGVGESVNVTVCRDSTGRTLVDSKGKVLAEIKPAIREFEVRNTEPGFRIVGEKEGFGDPCP